LGGFSQSDDFILIDRSFYSHHAGNSHSYLRSSSSPYQPALARRSPLASMQ
jgi:hypothetical protein